MKALSLILVLTGLAASAFGAAAAEPGHLKLQYAGYLVDSPILDARVDVALGPDGGPYRMSLSTSLVGMLGDMVPFHLKAASQGRDGKAGPRPTSYQSEMSIYDNRQSILLSYGANGSVTLSDDPPTEEGQAAVARGLLANTVDPLTAALGIILSVTDQERCAGTFRIFD